MATILKSATIENEFSFGGTLGVIQYEIPTDELRRGLTNFPEARDLKNGFDVADHSEENLNRLIPNTDTGNSSQWAPLLIMKRETIRGNGTVEVWLKGALINRATGNISLITSTDSHENIGQHGNRWVSSHADNWVIGRYKMFAPLYFWKELANRIKYI